MRRLIKTLFADYPCHLIEQGMQLSGNSRFCYLDGPWNKQDAVDYLTEVQIPIK